MTSLVFVDCETTSLDPVLGEIWEVGAIRRAKNGRQTEHHWFLPVTLVGSDPVSLRIGKFNERHPSLNNPGVITPARDFLYQFREITHGAHLVGNVISFDEERIRRLYNKWHAQVPSWHYHLVDVEALVAGRLQIAPPWKSVDLSDAIGVELQLEGESHSALPDARWAMRLYDAVYAHEKA